LPVRAWVPAFLAALVVAIVLLGSSPSGRGQLPSAGAWSGGSSWGNGIATAVFEPTQPGVTVSAVHGEAGYGLYAGLAGLGEYTTNGRLVTSADFADAHWQVTDRSTPYVLEHDYAATLGVGTGGSVAVEVNFSMAAADGPTGLSSTGVTYTIAEQGWPWASSSDVLGTLQPLWPNNTSLEHIDLSVQGTTMDCLSNETGTAQEYFDWGGSMVARGPSGQLAALEPSIELSGNPQYVPLVVLLVGAPGGYSQFSYDPYVGILTSAAPAGLTLSDLVLGLGVAGAGVFLAALVLVNVQRRPPSLELAEAP
jgi:hypothetical protein